MNEKKDPRLLSRSVPLLSGQEEYDAVHWRKREMQRKRFGIRLGWLTTGIALLLCGSILWLALSGSNIWVHSSGLPGQVAEWITKLEFMDLSGQSTDPGTGETQVALPEILEGILIPGRPDSDSASTENEGATVPGPSESSKPSLDWDTLYQFDYQSVPSGESPIVPMDLSLSNLGDAYINNGTGLKPDVEALLSMNFESAVVPVNLSRKSEPKVLIVHTHGTEAYSPDGAISFVDDGSEIARSEKIEENVVAVGKVLADALNEAGIETIHCTVMHDQLQYKDSYARAEETIERYLAAYPSIRLVIDLHRDSILKSSGELVRPVTLADDQAVAQVMCVVGSNWNGGEYPNWERNLSLALKLRAAMNQADEKICRPVYLKASTYNQELAPYSLLLEIGASGNSLDEAKRAAEKVAEALKDIIPKL